MMTADLGACEWFVWDLRRSSLVERGRLEQLVAEYLMRHPTAEPNELGNYLVEQGVLTRFQCDSLLNGKSQGLVLGPFIVHEELGKGTMGTVYKAKSKLNNEWYAVKVLPRRSMWNIRLARRKVRDFEQFQHHAVVPFVDVGTSGAMHYLAWPLVDGEPLNRLIEKGRQPAEEVALIGMLVAEGLEACHSRGIIHGLLKPSNIMVTLDATSEDKRVKILDFGIGSLLLETEGESVVDTMSQANTLATGLDCAAPESIMDPTSTSIYSDQYSLGCIMYYALTGQVPFPGNNAVEKMMAHQTKIPEPIKELAPETPDELVAVVDRMLQKRPEDRYPSISDVVTALRPMVLTAVRTGQTGAHRALSQQDIAKAIQDRQAAAQGQRPGSPPASGLRPPVMEPSRPAMRPSEPAAPVQVQTPQPPAAGMQTPPSPLTPQPQPPLPTRQDMFGKKPAAAVAAPEHETGWIQDGDLDNRVLDEPAPPPKGAAGPMIIQQQAPVQQQGLNLTMGKLLAIIGGIVFFMMLIMAVVVYFLIQALRPQ
jgi:serine/threonine-protein kinase